MFSSCRVASEHYDTAVSILFRCVAVTLLPRATRQGHDRITDFRSASQYNRLVGHTDGIIKRRGGNNAAPSVSRCCLSVTGRFSRPRRCRGSERVCHCRPQQNGSRSQGLGQRHNPRHKRTRRAEPELGRSIKPIDVGDERLITRTVAGKVLDPQGKWRARQLVEVDQPYLMADFRVAIGR